MVQMAGCMQGEKQIISGPREKFTNALMNHVPQMEIMMAFRESWKAGIGNFQVKMNDRFDKSIEIS